MELRQLVHETREALTRGEEAAAAAAARHMLEAFPLYVTAHQMLGESLIEQGELDAAYDHFSQAVVLDPLNTVSRLGLGVIAEERQDAASAYEAYLSAWEIKPEMDQLRDELVRVQEAMGRKRRLHPTRMALAMIHAGGGDVQRAMTELQGIVAANPDDVPARLALASLLWRSGDDEAAADACRAALQRLPNCARAMVMLADIHKRQEDASADELIERLLTIDPVGDLASEMAAAADGHDLTFLTEADAELPAFEVPTGDGASAGDAVADDEGGAAMTGDEADDSSADPWDSVLREMSGEAATTAEPEEPLQLFTWTDDAAPEDISVEFTDEQLEAARPGGAQQASEGSPVPETLPDDFAVPGLEPFQFEDLGGAGGEARASTVSAEEWGIEDQSPAEQPASAASSEPIDLTAGWDDLDRTLAEATPPADSSAGFDALLEGFDAQGITPLDPSALGGEQDWQPRSADEWESDIADDNLNEDRSAAPDLAAVIPEPEGVVAGAPVNAGTEDEAGTDDEFSVLDHRNEADTVGPDDTANADEQANAALSDAWGDMDDTSGDLGGVQGYTEILRNLDADQVGEPVPSGDEEIAAASSETADGDLDRDDAVAGVNTAEEASDVADAIAEEANVDDAETEETLEYEAYRRIDTEEIEHRLEDSASQIVTEEDDLPAITDRAETSPWPRSAPGLSGLSLSADAGFKLFARLREEKRSLVEMGIIKVDRQLESAKPDVAEDESADPVPLDRDAVSEFRRSLARISDASDGMVCQLEAMADDGADASVLRLLGEAYVRLGRPEDAAAQFRAAARQRNRG